MSRIDDIQLNISNAIKNSNLKQRELADKLNITRSAVAQYTSHNALPSLDILSYICEILDLDANEILCVNQSCKPTNKQNKNNQTITVHGGNVEISQNNK